MPDRPIEVLVRHIHRMIGEITGPDHSDRVLLARFIAQGDHAAFTALVHRHGPMVRGVCQRLLGPSADVDDAFQATFLLLVRKAVSIRKADSVASWLYGVAYRVARGIRNGVARRHAMERKAVQRAPDDPGMLAAWREVCVLLDEELQRLPEKYRAPLVLCYLEGLTRDEAARQLGWSLRTACRRLTKARELLRARLARRGLTLSAGLLAAVMTEHVAAGVPITLLNATLRGAILVAAGELIASAASGRVAFLVQEGLQIMLWTKLQAVTVIAFVLAGVAAAGLFLSAGRAGQGNDAEHQDQALGPVAVDNLPTQPAQDAQATDPDAPAIDLAQARERMKSLNNLRQIALAMINYADTYRHLPPPAIYSGQETGDAGGQAIQVEQQRVTGMVEDAQRRARRLLMTDPNAAHDLLKRTYAAIRDNPDLNEATRQLLSNHLETALRSVDTQGVRIKSQSARQPSDSVEGGRPAVSTAGAPMDLGGGATGLNVRKQVLPVLKGRALLSWRVMLLPYLEQEALFKEFKLDEPWDSPHNRKLLGKMPKVYAPVGDASKHNRATTFYQVFVGPGAGFEKHRALRHPEAFPDGASNTIMVIEAGRAVPWTKPEDLPFDPDAPLPELGGLIKDGINVVMFDGSPNTIRRDAEEAIIRAAITRNGREVVDRSRLFVQSGGGAGGQLRPDREQLLAEKKQLLEDYKQAKEIVEQLKAELKTTQAGVDKELAKLREENRRLQMDIAQLHEEAEKLADQLRANKRR